MKLDWQAYKISDHYAKKEVANQLQLFLYVIPVIAIILALVNLILGLTEIALATLMVPFFCGISLVALKKGYINTSMILIVSIMMVSTSIICILGSRIHEVGIIIFPVIVIFSGLVMNFRGVVITTSVVLFCIALIVFGDLWSFFPESEIKESKWLELAVVISVIIIHTFITYSFSRITRRNLSKIQDELKNQRRYKNEIAENLSEKTELLRLVHHRVKNNLLLVNSLIELESYGQPQVKNELKEITESIHAIARAHDPLYHTDDYKQVAIRPYLEKLINNFIQKNQVKSLNIEIEDCLIFHAKALHLGIIIQRILSCMQNLPLMELSVRLRKSSNQIHLDIYNQSENEFALKDTPSIKLLINESEGKVEIDERKVAISLLLFSEIVG
ncbi:MAG: histidine kinase dimerization/phosphoacceptor domain -containing protein [Ekhidna sp.]